MTEPGATDTNSHGSRAARLAVAGILVGGIAVALFVFVVPSVSGRAERELATAWRHQAAGEHAAALEAFDAALETASDWPKLRSVETLTGRTEAGLAVGADLEARGRADQAEPLYRRLQESAQGLPVPIRAELHWRLARCRLAAGDPIGASAESTALDLLLVGAAPGDRELIDRLAPALSDPDDPGHDWAMLRFEERRPSAPSRASAGRPRSPDEWRAVAARGASALPVILSEIARLEAVPDPTVARNLRRAIAEVALVAAPDVEEAMAGLAANSDRSTAGRAIAAAYLCRVADLPVFGPGKPADPALVKETVSLWKTIRAMPHDEAYRRRIAHLLGRLPSVLDGKPDDPATAWFREHVGGPVGTGLREWWTERADESPEIRLARALDHRGLTGAATPASLLRRYWSSSRLDRRLLHHLIGLVAPPGTVRPAAVFRNLAWPDGRVLDHSGEAVGRAWERALRAADNRPRHQVRTAGLLFLDRGVEPVLLWESVCAAPVGKIVAHHHRARIAIPRVPEEFRPRVGRHAIHLPGHPPAAEPSHRPAEGGASVDLRTTIALRVEPDTGYGPMLAWVAPAEQAAPVAAPEGYVSHHLIGRFETVDGTPRPVVLLLQAILEPYEGAPASRGEEWWKAGPVHNLERFGSDARERTTFDNWLRFRRVYDLTIPAGALLWSKTATEALRHLRTLRDGPATSDTYRDEFRILRSLGLMIDGETRDVVPAFRLLERDSHPLGNRAARHRYWEARLLATENPAIFDRARERLTATTGGDLPLYLESDVVERGTGLDAEVPEAMLRSVRRRSETPPGTGWLVLAGALVILLLVLALRPGPSANARLRPASVLLVVGVAVASNHVVIAGVDLRLSVVGMALATLGAVLCARAVRGFSRLIAPAAFLVATLALLFLSFAPRIEEGPVTNRVLMRLTWLTSGALVVAFTGLPLLAWALIREYRRSLPRRVVERLSVTGILLGVAGWLTYFLIPLISGRVADPTYQAGRYGEAASFAGLLLLAYVLARKRTYPGEYHSHGRRMIQRLPRQVRVLGAPPAVLITLAAALILTGGGGNYLVRSNWAGFSPGMWIVTGTMMICLILAANRASNVPAPWRRFARRLRA